MEAFDRVLITSGRGTPYQTEMPFDLIETPLLVLLSEMLMEKNT